MSVEGNPHPQMGSGPRVPAWKRIGLKLKYAKDSADGVAPENQSPSSSALNRDCPISSKEATSPNGHRQNAPARKKRKLPHTNGTKSTTSPTLEGVNTTHEPPANAFPGAFSSTEAKFQAHQPDFVESQNDQQSTSRRKSVTFTAETKQKDGFSAFKPARGFSAPVPKERPTPALTKQSQASLEPSRQRIKRKGSHKPKSAGRTTGRTIGNTTERPSTDEAPAYLQYLQHFHADKSTWKFHKTNQKILLRHIFDVRHVPPQHHTAVLQYVSGLQGSGVIQRLIKDATEVLREIAEKEGGAQGAEAMESSEARRAAYRAALKREIERYERSGAGRSEYDEQQLEALRDEVERGKRAEAILSELLQKELYPERSEPPVQRERQTSTPNSTANGSLRTSITDSTSRTSATKPKRKKRKTRTAAFSDNSDSDGDSSESEDDNRRRKGPKSLQEALSATPESKANGQPRKIAPLNCVKPSGKHAIFDDNFLDQLFPKKKTYHETAPKRKAGAKDKGRGFAYTHGTRADESESESESE